MKYNLVYYEEAKLDVVNAKLWYSIQQKDLDKRFAIAVKSAILVLQNNPFLYQVKHKNIRIAHVKTFPYGVHFYVNNNQIVIVAILHHKKQYY